MNTHECNSHADLAANMIGRSNARRGARRIFAVMQNRRLNQHLIYTVVDEVCVCILSESRVSLMSYCIADIYCSVL